MTKAQHIKTGEEGEALAAAHLEANGYIILETNWTFERYELDIIAQQDETVVFVEVKTRRGSSHGFPEQAVTRKKAKTLLEGASIYLEENHLENEIRFDIISVLLEKTNPEILHLEDGIQPNELS